jgi:hypothetical protein
MEMNGIVHTSGRIGLTRKYGNGLIEEAAADRKLPRKVANLDIQN